MAKTRLDERMSEMVQNLMRREPLVEELRPLRKTIVSTRDHGATYRPSTSPKYIFSVNPKAVYNLAAGVRLIKQRLGIGFDHLYKSSKHADPDISRNSRTSDEGSSRSSETSGGHIHGADGDLYDANGERGYCLSATEPYPKLMSAHFVQSPKVAILHIDPGPQPPISLLSILSTFCMCGASDPIDKFFAFLGLTAKGRAESTPNHYTLKADYSSSVPEVYITATVSMLKSSGVTVLSHFQDPSLTQVSDLPSWVPDFSVDIGRSIIEVQESSPWAASGERQTAPFIIIDDNHLILEGVMIDTTSGITSLKGCYFERVAKLALSTPKWYLNNHGLPPTFTPYGSDVSDNHRKPILLPSIDDTDFPCISRVDALWRTLTADSFGDSCPAPARCGFGFSDWVSLHLERAERLVSKNYLLRSRPTTQEKYILHRMTSKFDLWNALDIDEVGGFYTLEELEITKQTSLNKSESGCQSNTGAGKTGDTEIDGRGLRYLPDSRRLTQVAKRELRLNKDRLRAIQTNNLTTHEKARLSAFETRMREVKAGRRLFRTEKGYLGMGSVSTEVGDQVWVLEGANVPFVLRPVGDGRYRLIGAAYFHGIMWGEALIGEHTFREVILE
jgi:hypothetical protein